MILREQKSKTYKNKDRQIIGQHIKPRSEYKKILNEANTINS